MEKKGMKKSTFLGVWSGVFALILAFMLVLTIVLNSYDSIVTQFLGSVGGGITASDGTGDTEYFKLDADYTADKQAALNKQMADEAVVLLRNEGGKLPITKSGAAVTLFGMAATAGSSTGTGSGEVSIAGQSIVKSLQDAGFKINEEVISHYAKNSTAHGTGTAAGGGGDKGEWSLGKEADFPTGALADTFKSYSDAAIFVINRGCGEGGDLPRTMDNHGGAYEDNYLTLSPSEKATLEGIRDSKAFDAVIMLVNCPNPMELGELDKYGVDAALWYAGLGTVGLESVGEILAGKVNPSARLVDTYVFDNLSNPAAQNHGDFRFLINGEPTQAYTNYAESIYVGYRYYETRYEDAVMGVNNAGSYDYAKTVVYPFGYGLSYTEFEWSNYSASVNGDTVTVKVDVKNVGSMAGKDVVEIYFQSPYTDYDRQNGVEKSAVSLVEFGKTKLLNPGESETVEISFPVSDMKSYDAYGQYKTYILEAGDYYITAARDSHEAVNNILLKKGYSNIVGTGDANRAEKYAVSETKALDTAPTGEKIGNLFDDAALDRDTYLSRADWSKMDFSAPAGVEGVLGAGSLTTATGSGAGSNTMGASGLFGTMTPSDAFLAELNKSGYEASGNPKSIDSYEANRTYSEDSGIELVDLQGLEYDNPMWDTLLNEMKFSEIYELYGHAGYGTIEIKSINKPKTLEYDGPTGINSFVNDTAGYSYPNEIAMAATWNPELLYEEGRLIGNDMIKMSEGIYKVSGWYAPAVNIHRTPFSGRNYEYYSEDPVLTGKMVTQVLKGVQSKGAYVYMKHYALNDQESNRSANGRVATFSTEQAMREIYLKAFEYGVVDGGATGIMSSNNRIGARIAFGSWPLMTGILRNEWGFHGAIITDYTSGVTPAFADQILAAGGDLIMTSAWNAQTGVVSDFNAEWTRAELRRAAHDALYIQANSLAMNGLSHGAVYNPGFPIYKIILFALWVIAVAGIAFGAFRVYRTIPWTEEQWYSRKRMDKKAKIIMWSVIGAVAIVLIILFCIFLLPEIIKAFVM
ncbi:MAG: glycoside hydrolase family 3 C-terminal domain-containing protein [Oscillospiraceae bacterium]|nr:glycoside hydrolase family 3 C-terminal domain-containing protein [Oscillospiraceae bacterium]